MATRRATSTSNFGVGRRESHDASGFYARFSPPELTDDDEVRSAVPLDDPFQLGDARRMDAVPDGSVALVVTSPPYFAGKQYEEELERDGVPASYVEYLTLLGEVFAECKKKLEPGGRIAINVANLGRKPYRSLAADVTRILQDDLGLLLRGEIVWRKGEGANGSCAWGSFRSAANPVLRDTTERVVVASKGRFDRARSAKQRERESLPFESTLTTDDFLAGTLDVWDIPPESARRVQHPAPFPVELPERLIRLYTFRHDLVLDPFMGSGSTLVAAARADRRYAGFDLDPEYVAIARERVADELAEPGVDEPLARALHEGKKAPDLAEDVLREAGFVIRADGRGRRIRGTGVTVDVVAEDAAGRPWYFDVSGPFSSTRGGLLRTDAVWRALGRAHVLREQRIAPLVLLTSELPRRGSEGDNALRAAGQAAFFDVVAMLSKDGRDRLRRYAHGDCEEPVSGFW
ncbi:MAG TPA: site-specific DNA-methyltransferase [Acidimicrobiia bacterium]|jgi:site-specific DNA-methyltransferase (adenine-specific)